MYTLKKKEEKKKESNKTTDAFSEKMQAMGLGKSQEVVLLACFFSGMTLDFSVLCRNITDPPSHRRGAWDSTGTSIALELRWLLVLCFRELRPNPQTAPRGAGAASGAAPLRRLLPPWNPPGYQSMSIFLPTPAGNFNDH